VGTARATATASPSNTMCLRRCSFFCARHVSVVDRLCACRTGPVRPMGSSALPAALPALGLQSAGSWRCFFPLRLQLPRAVISSQQPRLLGCRRLHACLGLLLLFVAALVGASSLPAHARAASSRRHQSGPILRLQRPVCLRAFRLCVWPAAVPVCGGLIRDHPQRQQRRRRRRAYGCSSDKCAPSGGALHSASCESTSSHRSGQARLLPASALLERHCGGSKLLQESWFRLQKSWLHAAGILVPTAAATGFTTGGLAGRRRNE
jgi:hypothetical protein